MIILDGKKLSEKILNELEKEIKTKQLKLKLAVILIGDNKISEIYIREKKNACNKIGVGFELFKFSPDISQPELKEKILKIVNEPNNSGIVIQLPLPAINFCQSGLSSANRRRTGEAKIWAGEPQIFNTQEILNLIPIEKDIDVLSNSSFDKFLKGELLILPPIVGAVKRLLEEYKISLKNNPIENPSAFYGARKIVLIGKGKLVGMPLSIWLKNQKLDFSLVDKKTENIAEIVKQSDVIISGAGAPNLVKNDMIKQGAILIDAGSSSENGKIKGDIDKSAYEKASFVAPVPGGVGPMTIACLLANLIKLNS